MARTGPQKIPGAVLDLFFGGGHYSGSDMEVNTGLLHTTEGATLVDYDSGAVAPNVTGVPDFIRQRLFWHQHFDVDESARALVNAAGGVQTNTLNVFQVELVGTCDPATHARWTAAGVQHIYWPEPPDWAVRDLAWLMRWLHDEHHVPLTGIPEWMAYPASYGQTRVRMSFAQWTAFSGWCGHQHAPENVHGDPGALPFARILAAAKSSTAPSPAPAPTPTPAPVPEDDMTPDQIAGAPLPFWGPDGKIDPTKTASLGDYLGGLDLAARATKATLAAIQATQAAGNVTLKLLLDQNQHVDTAAVLAAIHAISEDAKAAVEKAIAEGVDVRVAVGTTTPKGN